MSPNQSVQRNNSLVQHSTIYHCYY